MKEKLAGKPLTHRREKVKRNKKTEIARKKLELENMDVETLRRQKTFGVNILFEKEKKQEREKFIIDKIKKKLLPDNDDLYIKYNSEERSYQILTDDEQKERKDLLKKSQNNKQENFKKLKIKMSLKN